MRDRDVVAAIVEGDPAGLAAAYDAYAPALHAYCRTLLGEPADAADAVQDTFVIAAAKLSGLREPDRLRPWLYAVARNECHRRLRAQARQAGLDEAEGLTDDSADVSGSAQRGELRGLVLAAVGGLNPGDREIIELNLRHDLDGADLAGALGVPLKQAHALASRARSQFERSLGALLVARTGRRQCADLDAMLASWDGELTPLLRKRVSRHIESCEVCGERKRRVLSPAMLLSIVPLVPLPPALRHQVLRLVSDSVAQAATYRAHVVARAGTFDAHGFPAQVAPPAPVRWARRRSGGGSVTASVGIVAALIFLGGGTVAVLLLLGGSGGHRLDVAGPGAAPGHSAPPAAGPATGPASSAAAPPAGAGPGSSAAPAASPAPEPSPEASGSPAPTASPPPHPAPPHPAPPSSPPQSSPPPPPPSSAPPAAGTLGESPSTVILSQQPAAAPAARPAAARPPAATPPAATPSAPTPRAATPSAPIPSAPIPSWKSGGTWSGTFTLTATGGPVSFVVSAPSPFTVSPQITTVQPGTPLTVTVSVTASDRIPFLSVLTIAPGGLKILVEFPPAQSPPTPSPPPYSPPPSSPPPSSPPPPESPAARLP